MYDKRANVAPFGVNKCCEESPSTWLSYCSISWGCNLIGVASISRLPLPVIVPSLEFVSSAPLDDAYIVEENMKPFLKGFTLYWFLDFNKNVLDGFELQTAYIFCFFFYGKREFDNNINVICLACSEVSFYTNYSTHCLRTVYKLSTGLKILSNLNCKWRKRIQNPSLPLSLLASWTVI